jgi:hypothetical protein
MEFLCRTNKCGCSQVVIGAGCSDVPMTTTNLPQELLNNIVDFLHDDKPALAACSLVSRALLHQSRIHKLFRITYIAVRSQVIEEEIAHHIKELTVLGVYQGMWNEIFKCTGLHRLTLYNVSFQTFPRSEFLLFPNLTRLDLRRCSFLDSSPSFSRFLCGFPALDSIQVYATLIGHQAITPEVEHCPPFSDTLSTQCANLPRLMDSLIKIPGGIHFTSITVGVLNCT